MRRKLERVEYWEDETPPPTLTKASPAFQSLLAQRYRSGMLEEILAAPYRQRQKIEEAQFARIQKMVQIAYEKVPLYHEKYRAAGFHPRDLKSWNDYHQLPCVTKDELIAAWPEGCINRDYDPKELFYTRSSGSSGKTLQIAVDSEAILIDTLQGIRQFWLQTGGSYDPQDIVVHIYTVPWWVDNVDGDYQTVFISSLIVPERIASILEHVQPDILSLYPTNLKSILPFLSKEATKRLKLVVVHSEISSKSERVEWKNKLGVPVLDEYSSEELTRIALELPCGHYHLCEDTVRIDVLDQNLQPIQSGIGIVCGTNLLNTAMPFIKYLQDDLVLLEEEEACAIQWRQIRAIEGRSNDYFITVDGKIVPAGTLLDLTYRWMFDTGINIEEFEIIQEDVRKVRVRIYDPTLVKSPHKKEKAEDYFNKLLKKVLGDVCITFEISRSRIERGKKRRPIRREFKA